MTAVDNSPVIVLGGGVAGLAAALDLARRSVASLVVERGSYLGGQAARFCCKATDVCARCGACRVGDLLAEAAGAPEISFVSRAMAVGARPLDQGWEVDLAPQAGSGDPDPLARPLAQKTTVTCGAVVLAVGHTPFNPQKKTRFGFGRVAGVATAADLEKKLAAGEPPQGKRLAFIQCVGSRDRSLGNLYCSRLCCGFALRMARQIKHQDPEKEITFFHMDVQRYGRAWEEELAQMRAGIRFVRAMPGEVASSGNGPRVHFADQNGEQQHEDFDLVVLSQGLTPPMAAASLQEMFKTELTADGFLGVEGQTGLSGAPGVFVAGSAGGPLSITESIEQASAAAAGAWLHLGQAAKEAGHG